MSYYTKYRPQTIGDLDLATARESLASILKSGKFSHAYLLTGPKGTGKTSSARIVAKVLNCALNTPGVLREPCNQCENCRRITSGSSLACIEMDAASNRGIDDIRTLRERVGLAPAEGRFTVYIIDEVHMLTTEAFNALLKTLEEPPDHAVFILCTTDPQKIPETVISRCTRIQLQKATKDEVIKSLNKAVVGESLKLDSGVLELLAEAVDGSFRDGMKLLEQLSQQTEGQILIESALTAVGKGEDYDAENLYVAMMNFDAEAALQEIESRENSGVDLGLYGKRILEMIRAKLRAAVTKNDDQVKKIIALAEVVDQAIVKMKLSSMPQLIFESMIVGWCMKGEKKPVESPRVVATEQPVVHQPAPQPVVTQPVVPRPIKEVVAEVVEVKKVMQGYYLGSLEEVSQKWQLILAAVRPFNHSLEALLRSARPKALDNGTLRVEAFYKFHKEQLEQDRHRKQLEEAIGGVLGGNIRLEIILGNRTANRPEDIKVENISGSVEDEALVKAAEEIFG